MKQIYLLLFSCSLCFGQLPNIAFDGINNWSTHPSIIFNTSTNEAAITSNGNNNVLTSITVNLTTPPAEFYLVADIMLQNVTFDQASIRNPFIVIRNQAGNVIDRYTMKNDLNSTWFKSGVKISNYTDNQITIEFGVNRANGTMIVKSPILTATEPVFTYEFPFNIPSDVSTTLNIDLLEKHYFENDLLSSNTHFVFAKVPWGDTALQNAISTHFPMSNLRFPGGSVGNFYNYQTDNFFINSHTSNNLVNYNAQGRTLDYNGYNNFVQNTQSTSTYMLNIMFNDVMDAKNEYQNRFSSGLPMKWIELGNEMYLNENQVGPYVSDITSYLSHSQQIASEIKSINPNAQIAVCLEKDDFNPGEWNEILSQNQTYFEAATLHNYIALDHYFYSKYISFGMLTSYKLSMDRFTKYNQLFPNKPLLLTEWGITGNVDAPYFLEVLGIADAFLAIEKANEMNIIKQAGIHMLYKNNANSSATLMYYDGSNNLRFTSKGKLYSKLFEVFKNSEVFNAETLSAELIPGLRAVNAKMIKKGNQYKIFAVNKLPVNSPLVLNINGHLFNGNYTLETYTNNMDNPTNGILASTNSWSTTTGNGSVSLPASSICIVTIDENEINLLFDSCSNTTTWNGTSWDNGLPTIEKQVIFEGNYTALTSIECCAVQVSNNANVNFPSGSTLNVFNAINVDLGSSLTIENNAAIIQLNPNATNSGNIIIERNSSPMRRLDYTAWSSPVSNQELQSFSPSTLPNRFYEYLYTGTTTPTAYQAVNPMLNFTPGKGYMIRSANNWPTTPTIFNGTFIGIANNGNYNQNLGQGYNLIGNPYPSPINAIDFLRKNPTVSALYFWTNLIPASGGLYPVNNYASFSLLGGVASASSSEIPNGYIQTGQGFFVNAKSASTILFENEMRNNSNSSSQFFRNSVSMEENTNHLIRLNFKNNSNEFNQILVGYSTISTDDYDNQIDVEVLNSSNEQLYTLMNNTEYVIQGYGLPFYESDEISLGFNVSSDGNYKIEIENLEGLFINQDIYIKDTFSNTYHNLKENPFSFYSSSGKFNNRLKIVFNKPMFDDEVNSNTYIYKSQSGDWIITSESEINKVEVYDVSGKLIEINNSVQNNTYEINKKISSGVYFVKCTLKNKIKILKIIE